MTTSVAVFPPGFRVTDANDNPVSGATIEFYSAATTTPKTVYSDSDLTIPIGTSVTTDAGGYPTSGGNKTLVYVDTAYKVIIKDADGAVIATHDRVPGPVGGSTSSTSTASTTFGMGVGDVKISSAATPDAGFIRLAETEQSLLKADYPDLNAWCAAQGYPWGSTSTTFDIPRAAGYFLRFAATSSSIDTAGSRVAGSIQGDQYAAHTHANTATVNDPGHLHAELSDTFLAAGGGTTIYRIGGNNNGHIVGTGFTGISVTMNNASSGTGTETRAKNVAFHADMLAVPALVSAGLVGAAGLAYRFNSTTSGASVTTGTLAFNNATLTSATALYVYETDANSTNLAGVLQGIPTGSLFYMAKVGAPANWIAATVSSTATDAGSYDSFTLSSVQTGGTISNGDLLTVTVMRAGVAGAAGEAGAAGVDGATAIYVQSSAPSVNNGALWIRTTDGEVFKCIAGSWTDQGYTTNGATGATGSAGAGVPTGGTTGQVLKKNSGTDYDTSWGTALGGGGSSGHGQCRLTKSGANLILLPYNGNQLLVNGTACTVPDAGVTLSASGLSVGTTYYIYATASAGAVNAIEASTTTHATDTATSGNKGVEIKSGDATRTLVGMAHVITGPAWADTTTQRFVASWFNRFTATMGVRLGTNATTTSTTFVEMSTAIRLEFLSWATEPPDITAGGFFTNSGSGGVTYGTLWFDGAWVSPTQSSVVAAPSGGSACLFCVRAVPSGLSEGYHYATVAGRVGSGTGTFGGSGSDDGNGCYVIGTIRQ